MKSPGDLDLFTEMQAFMTGAMDERCSRAKGITSEVLFNMLIPELLQNDLKAIRALCEGIASIEVWQRVCFETNAMVERGLFRNEEERLALTQSRDILWMWVRLLQEHHQIVTESARRLGEILEEGAVRDFMKRAAEELGGRE